MEWGTKDDEILLRLKKICFLAGKGFVVKRIQGGELMLC